METKIEITNYRVEVMCLLKTAAELHKFSLPCDDYNGGGDTHYDIALMNIGRHIEFTPRFFIGTEWIYVTLTFKCKTNTSLTSSDLSNIFDEFGYLFKSAKYFWDCAVEEYIKKKG